MRPPCPSLARARDAELLASLPADERERIAARHAADREAVEAIQAAKTTADVLAADSAAAHRAVRVKRSPAFQSKRRRRAAPVTVSYLPGFGPADQEVPE